jgi:uncharacterized protein with HEPN domain
MNRRETLRAEHIKNCIVQIRSLLAGRTVESLDSDVVAWAALERFFEIISEASRHISSETKDRYGPDVAWRPIADLGNHLRHVYERVQLKVLWNVYLNDLDALEGVVDAILAAETPQS